MSLINYFISSCLATIFSILIALIFNDKKQVFKNKKTILGIMFLYFGITILYIYLEGFIKTLLLSFILVLFINKIFNQNLNKSIVISTYIFICYFIAELIFGIVFLLILKIDVSLLTNENIVVLNNIFLGSLAYIIASIPIIKKVFNNLITDKKNNEYFILFILIIISIGIFGNKQGISKSSIELILNYLLIIIFSIIIYYLLKEKIKHENINTKYDQLFNYIEKYEKELNEKNLIIHEFKNQIIVINGLSNKNNNKLKNYLESIIKDIKKVETKSLCNIENIPSGGLKGLIYYKLCTIVEDKINKYININSNTIKTPFNKIKPELYKDILKIIGIYLDNAIEAAELSVKKIVSLEMFYEQKKFNIIITNTYKNIETEKIYNIGYSTKGKNRGYGLALARRLINKYDNISENVEINDGYYIQKVTIDLKNIPQ